MSKSVSIIIPFYNNWELTHQRMMELHTYIPFQVEIILVDDCSTDENIAGGMGWWKTQSKHRVICIKNKKNLGFGGAFNKGCQRASEDVYVLLSNDVQVSGDFVSLILEKLKKDEKTLIGGQVLYHDTGWNVLNINGKPKLFPYAMGWLLACTKEAWKDLGGFDQIYEKFDYEDVDLSTTAIHKGYKLVALDYRRLRHFSALTVRKYYPDREAYTMKNQKRFIKKWSKILKDE